MMSLRMGRLDAAVSARTSQTQPAFPAMLKNAGDLADESTDMPEAIGCGSCRRVPFIWQDDGLDIERSHLHQKTSLRRRPLTTLATFRSAEPSLRLLGHRLVVDSEVSHRLYSEARPECGPWSAQP